MLCRGVLSCAQRGTHDSLHAVYQTVPGMVYHKVYGERLGENAWSDNWIITEGRCQYLWSLCNF